MNGTKPRPKKRHWWSKEPANEEEILDDDLVNLLEDVEGEFEVSFEYHAQRLRELKEALRGRQQTERE